MKLISRNFSIFSDPFVRIIQVNSNGKVVRKKKTQTVIASKEPEFNETLNFELSSHQIEYMSFVVMIISKKPSSKAESASDRVSYSKSLLDNAPNYLSSWLRYPKEIDII